MNFSRVLAANLQNLPATLRKQNFSKITKALLGKLNDHNYPSLKALCLLFWKVSVGVIGSR